MALVKKGPVFILLLLLILFGCTRNPLDVNTSNIKTKPLEILRLEDDLFTLDENNFEAASKNIEQKYGTFYEHFLMNFISRNGTSDSTYKQNLLSFINDKDIRAAYHSVKVLYPNSKVKELEPELNAMVKRFKYHFPNKPIPQRFITCTAGWNYAFSYMDSALSVSLDMYLGDSSKFYQMLRYPQYQTRKMNSSYILPDVARGWLLTEFDNDMPENTLLNHTIFYGKLYYAINALLPHKNDSLIIGYTSTQMQYCDEFERKLWGYFAEKNRLYETSLTTIRELTSDGPFTGAISRECPPRIAMWVGWQIVKSYMKNNELVTLKELMQEKNAQKILNKSKYRP
jgi:hypothetical protein